MDGLFLRNRKILTIATMRTVWYVGDERRPILKMNNSWVPIILTAILCIGWGVFVVTWYEHLLAKRLEVSRQLVIERETQTVRIGLLEMALGECAYLCERGDLVSAYTIAANSIGGEFVTLRGKENA